jgi:hypothetical protein
MTSAVIPTASRPPMIAASSGCIVELISFSELMNDFILLPR